MNELTPLPDTCNVALKEWGIVCEAIRRGRQHLLFRTGGIEETKTGFQARHDSFWLFPTQFHQTTELVTEEFSNEYRSIEPFLTPASGTKIPLQIFCQVTGVFYISKYEKLQQLCNWHVLSEEVLRQRFEYRRAGLYVLTLQSYYSTSPLCLEHCERYNGCKSWVELENEISTVDLNSIPSSEEALDQVQILANTA